MAKRPRKPRSLETYEEYKRESGWYLAAWRDKAGLTLEELASEVGTSKGVVSDLETGAKRANGALAQRFNKDDVDKFARALGTRGGFLLDVNPFAPGADIHDLNGKLQSLDERGLELVRQFTDTVLRGSGTKG